MKKKLIICGPTCSGKTILRKRLEDKGFTFDISYTSRPKRPNEKQGVHYQFISKDEFIRRMSEHFFYEYVQYDEYFYGTGKNEWHNSDCFIIETDGIRHILPEDRKICFIVYLNPSIETRTVRMVKERGWSPKEVASRLITDAKKFNNFKDYDIIITNSNF